MINKQSQVDITHYVQIQVAAMTTTKEEKSHNCRTNGAAVTEVPFLATASCSFDSPLTIPKSLLCGREGRLDVGDWVEALRQKALTS